MHLPIIKARIEKFLMVAYLVKLSAIYVDLSSRLHKTANEKCCKITFLQNDIFAVMSIRLVSLSDRGDENINDLISPDPPITFWEHYGGIIFSAKKKDFLIIISRGLQCCQMLRGFKI